MAEIHPVHASIRTVLASGHRVRPRNMERATMSRDMAENLERIAMQIFADCTNVGVPFQNAILAVYLSGINHGAACAKETGHD